MLIDCFEALSDKEIRSFTPFTQVEMCSNCIFPPCTPSQWKSSTLLNTGYISQFQIKVTIIALTNVNKLCPGLAFWCFPWAGFAKETSLFSKWLLLSWAIDHSLSPLGAESSISTLYWGNMLQHCLWSTRVKCGEKSVPLLYSMLMNVCHIYLIFN